MGQLGPNVTREAPVKQVVAVALVFLGDADDGLDSGVNGHGDAG